jgi:hypothetical protein
VGDARPAGQSCPDAQGDRARAEPTVCDARLRLGAVSPLHPSGTPVRGRLCPMPTSHVSPPVELDAVRRYISVSSKTPRLLREHHRRTEEVIRWADKPAFSREFATVRIRDRQATLVGSAVGGWRQQLWRDVAASGPRMPYPPSRAAARPPPSSRSSSRRNSSRHGASARVNTRCGVPESTTLAGRSAEQ